jgi:aerobic-type carbon monoxide dehydrogenase small subunit (CoxS/CutS family)
MIENIRFKLNGRPVSLSVETEQMLLAVLRYDLGLTGSKYGCGEGLCGACTVLVNNEAVRSCQYPLKDVGGKEVVTIEGLARDGKLHPLQEAFVRHDALQCGYCTSGMIMNAYGLLLKNPRPTRREIVVGMEGNLCRCGAYIRIIEAIQDAARDMRGGK